MAGKSRRILELDGIRGLAVLMVLVWHYFNCQLDPITKGTPLAYAGKATCIFWSGVDLFFVLSGFLIGGILLDHRGAKNQFKVFYTRRACRILPPYFLLLGVYVLAVYLLKFPDNPRFAWMFADPMPVWSYATFTQNIAMGWQESFGAEFLGVTWSLAVEEQFYIFLPLLMLLLPRKAMLPSLVALTVAAPLLRWWQPGFILAFVNTPWRMDSLLLGVLAAMAVRSAGFTAFYAERKRWFYAAFVVLLMGAGLLTKQGAFGGQSHLWLACLYALLILLPVLDEGRGWWGILRFAPLRFFGTISYGLYLYHQPVSGFLHGWIRSAKPTVTVGNGWLITLLALVISIGLAVLSFYVFERWFLRIGRKVEYKA